MLGVAKVLMIGASGFIAPLYIEQSAVCLIAK